MSVSQINYTRAVQVYAGGYANIPYPSIVRQDVNTSVLSTYLVDANAKFLSMGLNNGDIIYNDTSKTCATILEVESDTRLKLNFDLFTGTPQSYTIFKASPQDVLGNRGCSLFISSNDTIVVKTVGGDIVTFENIWPGTILPVQVVQLVSSLTNTNVALW